MLGQIIAANLAVTRAAAPVPSTSSWPPTQPVRLNFGSFDAQIEPMGFRTDLYLVTAEGETRVMDRHELEHYVQLFQPKHPVDESDWQPGHLPHMGKCTVNGDDGVPQAQRLDNHVDFGPAAPRMGQGTGTGATGATPWDQRFLHTPTRHEQFQTDMERNGQINLLNAAQVVILAAAGRDHRDYLDQTAPLGNALVAVGGAYAHAATNPVMSAPRPEVVPVPQRTGERTTVLPVAAGAAQHIPGAQFIQPNAEEQATFRLSVDEHREFGLTEFRDGRYVARVGVEDRVQVLASPDVARTLHTHPRSQVALPSAGDLATFGHACYRPDTVHEILGDLWPNTRAAVAGMPGVEPLPPAPIKYSVTTGQVRAAVGVPVVVPFYE